MPRERSSHSVIRQQPPQSVTRDAPGQLLSEPCFISYNPTFTELCGVSPQLMLIEQRSEKFAHEAGVFVPSTNTNYFTSNYQDGGKVSIYATDCSDFSIASVPQSVNDKLPNANGACNYEGNILFCTQGSLTEPSALVLMDPRTLVTSPIVDNLYGIPFNSLNDVVVHHQTGDLWFTDPTYGYQQGFRPMPQLPSQLYRFCPSSGEVSCVADGFVECNGLCFSPDYCKLYVTDTGAARALGTAGNELDSRKPSTIYQYDVVNDGIRLANRQVFAYCTRGVPDGIKCDSAGNVYAGCGDGIHVWSSYGSLLGKIYIGSMVANFNFGPCGIWIFAENCLYLCRFAMKGALAEVEGHQKLFPS